MFLMVQDRRVNTDAVRYYTGWYRASVRQYLVLIEFIGESEGATFIECEDQEEQLAILDKLDRVLLVGGAPSQV